MKIRKSEPPPPRGPFPAAAPVKTAAELAEEWRRRQAEKRRLDCLGGCPEETAGLAAGVCGLVYHPFFVIEGRLKDEGAGEFQFFDRGGSQAVGFERAGTLWLVFRGSESFPETEMFLDWGHDLLALPWGWPPRHFGFARAWRKIREPVLQWVRRRQSGRGLVLTGHSLGGALALMAADEVAAAHLARIDAVITFGAPRVGTWPWARRYRQRGAQIGPGGAVGKTLGGVTWRIQNEGDIVTYVPPLFFRPCGQAVSSTSLQWQTIVSSGTPVSAAEEGWRARLRFAYGTAKKTLPYVPLTLLIDLLLAIAETAPEHFIRHYGPAFPKRPFPDMPAPRPPSGRKSFLNRILALVKISIALGLFAALGYAGWWASRVSPEITGGLLFLTVVYSILGAVSMPTTLTPGRLGWPSKAILDSLRRG